MDRQSQSSSFLGSASSSTHSNDSLSSSTNSTGTQIHHRSNLRPQIGGMPRENAQNFALPSTVSLPDLDEAPEPNADIPSSPPAKYRFETPEEAAERHRRVTSLTRRALIDTQRNIEDYSSSGSSAGPSIEESRVVTQRGPAESRRRPRATSTGSISMQDVPVSQNSEHTTIAPCTPDQDDGLMQRHTAQHRTPSVSRVTSNPMPNGSGASALPNGSQHGAGHKANMPSSTGQEYGRSDLERGYVNGDFITTTTAGGLAKPSKPETRKRDFLKRIFCIYH